MHSLTSRPNTPSVHSFVSFSYYPKSMPIERDLGLIALTMTLLPEWAWLRLIDVALGPSSTTLTSPGVGRLIVFIDRRVVL